MAYPKFKPDYKGKSRVKLISKKIDPEFRKNFTFIDVNKLKKEWADTGHKLKENPLPEQTKQYEKLRIGREKFLVNLNFLFYDLLRIVLNQCQLMDVSTTL